MFIRIFEQAEQLLLLMSKTQFSMGKSPLPPEKGKSVQTRAWFLELNLTFPAQFPPLTQQFQVSLDTGLFSYWFITSPWFIPPRNVLQKSSNKCGMFELAGIFQVLCRAVVSLFCQAGIFFATLLWRNDAIQALIHKGIKILQKKVYFSL